MNCPRVSMAAAMSLRSEPDSLLDQSLSQRVFGIAMTCLHLPLSLVRVQCVGSISALHRRMVFR